MVACNSCGKPRRRAKFAEEGKQLGHWGSIMSTEIETTGRARIVGVSIPFWDLVFLLVKLTVAAIPAILGGGVAIFFTTLFAGGTHGY